MVRLSYIVFIGIALVCVFAEELNSNQYDDIDINTLLANDKLRNQYYMCFMDIGPCRTGSMKFFKKIIFEAVPTQCKKCTEKQKVYLEQIIEWYTTNRPNEWNAFIRKILQDIRKKNAQ